MKIGGVFQDAKRATLKESGLAIQIQTKMR